MHAQCEEDAESTYRLSIIGASHAWLIRFHSYHGVQTLLLAMNFCMISRSGQRHNSEDAVGGLIRLAVWEFSKASILAFLFVSS